MTHDTGPALTPAVCRDRLLASHDAVMSCTRFAMPLVVPVELSYRDGEVLVTVHDRRLCGPLAGRVVALTVVGRPDPPDPGWAVAAVGMLSVSGDGALTFDASSLDGWTFAGDEAPRLDGSAGAHQA